LPFPPSKGAACAPGDNYPLYSILEQESAAVKQTRLFSQENQKIFTFFLPLLSFPGRKSGEETPETPLPSPPRRWLVRKFTRNHSAAAYWTLKLPSLAEVLVVSFIVKL